jgi:RNA polymerase sigma-70 factor (ECF subfamily)
MRAVTPDAMTRSRPRTIIYCVVPRDLAGELHEPLRRHWRDDASVEVIVDRRKAERRGVPRRRKTDAPPSGRERRHVRSAEGRRVADRRLARARVLPPPLPRKARPHKRRLAFVLRRLPSTQAAEDVDTARLVVEYQLGDRSALEDIYLRYFDRIYAYARVALRDPHTAEDVTQQVFTQVIEFLPRFQLRGETPFRHWLFRIARNAMLDAREARMRALPEEPALLELRREQGESRTAFDALDWLTDADLYVFVEQLPPSQREVLVLRYVLDMSGNEIAATLDRRPDAVRQLLSRALRTLERQLAASGRTRGSSDRSPMLARPRRAPVVSARRLALTERAHGASLAARGRAL